MKSIFWQRLRDLWHAEFFSPKDFLRRAIFICSMFAVVHLLNLQEFTSILNGTTGSLGLSWRLSAFLGLFYILLYLAFVLLVPILLLAAVISAAWRRYSAHEPRTNPPPQN